MKVLLLVGIIVIGLVLGALMIMGMQSRGGVAPGLSKGKLQDCARRPNCVSSEVPSDSPYYVAAFAVPREDFELAWERVADVIVAADGQISVQQPTYLAASFRSKIFGFIDDFECRRDGHTGTIQVRSGARVGYSDFNVNRNRVERLRTMLSRAMNK